MTKSEIPGMKQNCRQKIVMISWSRTAAFGEAIIRGFAKTCRNQSRYF